MDKQTTIACMIERHVYVEGKCRGCGMTESPKVDWSDQSILPSSRAWLESLGMDYEAETDMLTWQSDDLTFAVQVWLFESGPEWFICGESLGDQSPNTKHRVIQLFLALGIPIPKVGANPAEISDQDSLRLFAYQVSTQLTEADANEIDEMAKSPGVSVGDIFRQSLSLFWKNQKESSTEE